MARWKIKFYGKKGIIEVVTRETAQEAREAVALRLGIHPGDLDATKIEPRVELTCSSCGHKFKGKEYEYQTRDPSWIRCTLCKAACVVADRKRDYARAIERYNTILRKRNARKGEP